MLPPSSVRLYRCPRCALRERIESELKRLVSNDIVEEVHSSEWASSVVPIIKSDNSIRLCGDYKITINKYLPRDIHPVPRIEELTAKLSGGQKYSRLDFSQAFTQLALDVDSRSLTTINTHCGLFRYKRLCFGISSAPAIFQRTIEDVFKNVKNVVLYFDDLFVTGKDEAEHLQTLKEVLDICEAKGLRVKKSKCQFLQNLQFFVVFV